MPEISIQIKNKVATLTKPAEYVCGNGDYTVSFSFDEEWDGIGVKTARFQVGDTYVDILYEGNICTVPAFGKGAMLEIGVFSGADEALAEMRSTTTAMVRMKPGVRSRGGSPTNPTTTVYDQIMGLLNRISGAYKAPHIGENGNWWVLGNDTDIPATGPTGPAGPRGYSGLVPAVEVPYAAEITVSANTMTNIAPLSGPVSIGLGDGMTGIDNEWDFTLTQGESAQDVVLPEIHWGLEMAPTFEGGTTTVCRLYYVGDTLCGEWVSV